MKSILSVKVRLFIASIPVSVVLLIILMTNLSGNPANAKTGLGFASRADSDAVYAKYCARCHGADGQAQTAKGKQTRATDLTKSKIANAPGLKIIAKGKELMPGFKDSLTPDEIQGVMNYIRGFRK